MTGNTEFKTLFADFGQVAYFIICHLLTAQYVSDCQVFVHDTELFKVVILYLVVKVWSILCEIALLIRHGSWYCRIVNLFLHNLGQPRYDVSLSYDIENLVEGRNDSLVPLIYLKCWEILANKKSKYFVHNFCTFPEYKNTAKLKEFTEILQ